VTISELISALEEIRDDFGDHLLITEDEEELELAPHLRAIYENDEYINYVVELK
jgi:hypothetical protein